MRVVGDVNNTVIRTNFYLALANLKYCETNVNNNLRMTNWNRARGCKCAHQEDADGCGCSPLDYTLKQLR